MYDSELITISEFLSTFYRNQIAFFNVKKLKGITYIDVLTFRTSAEQNSRFATKNLPTIKELIIVKFVLSAFTKPSSKVLF